MNWSLILTVLFGLFTLWYAWFLSGRVAIAYFVRSKPILGEKSKHEFSYSGKPVKSLVINDIFIWNCGSRAVARRDISEFDKLRLVFSAGKFFDVLHSDSIAPRINPTAKIDQAENEIIVAFDMLNRGDAMVTSVTTDQISLPWITRIKLAGSVLNHNNSFKHIRHGSRSKIWLISFVIVTLITGLVGIYNSVDAANHLGAYAGLWHHWDSVRPLTLKLIPQTFVMLMVSFPFLYMAIEFLRDAFISFPKLIAQYETPKVTLNTKVK